MVQHTERIGLSLDLNVGNVIGEESYTVVKGGDRVIYGGAGFEPFDSILRFRGTLLIIKPDLA